MKQEAFRPVLSPSFVAQALGLTIPGVLSTQGFSTVTTDSRKIQPGCLFVALKGEKFDGHEFIAGAIEKGARGVICERGSPKNPDRAGGGALPSAVKVFPVEDTLAAYRRLGAAWRKEFQVPMVAVAGSVGKTTTKEILTAMLHGKWKSVLKTQGSQNGFVGIPMTLLELDASHGAAVIEVGIDEIGAMEKHVPLVSPTVAVLTAIGPEHLEKLQDVPTVAREEGLALSMTAKLGGTPVINLDDSWTRPFASTLRAAKSRFSFTLAASATPSEDTLKGTLSEDLTSLMVEGGGWKAFKIALPLPGRHNASNLMAALGVARALGLTPEEVQRGLENFKGADGRSEVRELPGKTLVLCDYYNANPSSVEAGLDVLTELSRRHEKEKGPAKRWACLADMLELGADEEKFHRGLASKLTTLAVENVLLYGPRMKALQDELKSRGFQGNVAHFESHAELARALREGFRAGDTVMIKGSRGMKMEEVWKLFEPHARS